MKVEMLGVEILDAEGTVVVEPGPLDTEELLALILAELRTLNGSFMRVEAKLDQRLNPSGGLFGRRDRGGPSSTGR